MDTIDPSKFHVLTINTADLAHAASTVYKTGVGIRETGTDIASAWKGLHEPYKGPGSSRLIGAVTPVQAHADRFGWECGQVGAALRDFATQIAPLKNKLQQLVTAAVALQQEQLADPDWRKKKSMVNRHNQLISDETRTWNQAILVTETCANRINHLTGGIQYHPSRDGKIDAPDELGLDPHLLPTKLPDGVNTDFGKTASRDKPWWEDATDGAGGLLHGLLIDGPTELGEGFAGLAGVTFANGHVGWDWHNSWETYKTIQSMGLPLLPIPGAQATLLIPGVRHRFTKGWKQMGKGFIAFDDWKHDKGRAAGKVTFNALTLGIPETRLGMAGRAGDIALTTTRALSKADLVNRGINLGTKHAVAVANKTVGTTVTHIGNGITELHNALPNLLERIPGDAGQAPHFHTDPPSAVEPRHDPPASSPKHSTPTPHTPHADAARHAPEPRLPARDANHLPTVQDLIDRIGKPHERPMHNLDQRTGSHPPADTPSTRAKEPAELGAHDETPREPVAHTNSDPNSGHTSGTRPHTTSGHESTAEGHTSRQSGHEYNNETEQHGSDSHRDGTALPHEHDHHGGPHEHPPGDAGHGPQPADHAGAHEHPGPRHGSGKTGSAALPHGLRKALIRSGTAGRETLRILDKYNTNVVLSHNSGYYFDPSANTVTLDMANPCPASDLAHEATHVQWHHEGRSADIARLGRQDYINGHIEEEVDASVNQIRANLDLQRGGAKIPDAPLQDHYLHGYKYGVQWLDQMARNQGWRATPQELRRAGELAARSSLYSAYQSGHVYPSMANVPYPDYYGRAWDLYHALRAKWGKTP